VPKRRKLNSKNPKYMDETVEVKDRRVLIREIDGVKIYAIFSE
tara:strand:- start:1457 stop:1585 length:129 start_codon:yes stop_codon:yes gene_type:complete